LKINIFNVSNTRALVAVVTLFETSKIWFSGMNSHFFLKEEMFFKRDSHDFSLCIVFPLGSMGSELFLDCFFRGSGRFYDWGLQWCFVQTARAVFVYLKANTVKVLLHVYM